LRRGHRYRLEFRGLSPGTVRGRRTRRRATTESLKNPLDRGRGWAYIAVHRDGRFLLALVLRVGYLLRSAPRLGAQQSNSGC
jgi:hypothetical protein